MTDKIDFQNLAHELMGEFTGVPYEINYRQLTSRYAPGGTVTNIIKKYTTRCIEGEITHAELTNGIAKIYDIKILVAALELEVIPKPKDKFLHRNRMFTVINVATDPAQALWSIIGRD